MRLAVLLPGPRSAPGPAGQPAQLHRHALSDDLVEVLYVQNLRSRALLAALHDSQASHRQQVLLPLRHTT